MPDDPLEEFYKNHPELKPGGAGGGAAARQMGLGPSTSAAKPPAAAPESKGQLPADAVVKGANAIDSKGIWWHNGPNGWQEGLPASATDRKEWGIGPSYSGAAGGGGGGTNYAQQNANDKAAIQLQNGGLRQMPASALQIGPSGTRYIYNGVVYTKDPTTTIFTTNGYTPNKADTNAALAYRQQQNGNPQTTSIAGAISNSAQPNSVQLPTTAPSVAATLTPEARPFAGLAGLAGTVQPGVSLPGFERYNQPGIGIPEEGRTLLRAPREDLNILHSNLPNGPQIQFGPGLRGVGQTGNNIMFGGTRTGGGLSERIEPQMLFPDLTASVPGTYVQGQGNVNDANRMFSLPFNIGPGGASLANIAGSNVQVNSPDKGVGMGFALNAMPSSNIGLATGRQLNADPALQAMETLALMSALGQMGGGGGAIDALTAANRAQYSGNPAQGQGTWFAGMAPGPQALPYVAPESPYGALQDAAVASAPEVGGVRGGGGGRAGGGAPSLPGPPAWTPGQGVAPAPASTGGFQLAPNFPAGAYGPAFGTDAQAWAAVNAALAAEKDRENGGGGEGRSFGEYARGGKVLSIPMGGFSRPFASGGDVIAPVQPGRTSAELAMAAPQPSSSNNVSPLASELSGTGTISGKPATADNGLGPEVKIDNGPLVFGTNELERSQLQPYQEAAVGAAQLQHARDTQSYIRGLGGLPKATEVPYVGGQVNQEALGPGQFYGYGTWLNNMIQAIGSKQQAIREAGATGDPAQLQYEINQLKQGAAPLNEVQAAQTKLAALGTPMPAEQLQGLANNLAHMQSLEGQVDPYGHPYYTAGQILEAKNQLSQAQNAANAISEQQNLVNNLLAKYGYDDRSLAAALANYNTQLNMKQASYDQAMKAAQTKQELQNLLAMPPPKFGGGGSMVTPERIWGVGDSGKVYFQVGEETRPGGPPMAERLTISPLHRPSTGMEMPMGKFARMAA